MAVAVATAIIGLIFFVVGCGFMKGWSLWWYLGLILNVLSALGSLLMFPAGLVSLAISIVILYYMTRPKVKAFFKI